MKTDLLTNKVNILNIDINNFTKHELLNELNAGVVFTPNIDHLVKLQKDESFYEAYLKAEYKVCDSRILLLKSRLGLLPYIKEQIAGSDLFPDFCDFHRHNRDIKVFLVGGTTESSLQKAMENINHKCDREIIVGGYSPPFGFEQDEIENQKIIDKIKESGANVVAVGVGAPKQELWIMQNKKFLPEIKLFFAIGATIEFQAGTLKRSPKLITKLGLEWAYRIYKEPLRLWKRYLYYDLPILYYILKQKFGVYTNPWRENEKHQHINSKDNIPVQA